MMKRLRFAAVGDNCVDKFLPPVSLSLIGGNAVNVAVQLARLGHESFYFGAIGADADGFRTRDALVANGVNVEHMLERPGKTAHTDIEALPSGERVFVFEDFGVCAGYRPTDRDIAVLKTMDHVHIGWLDDGGALRQLLAAAGVSVSQDISVNADPANLGIEGLTVAFGSADGGGELAERAAAGLLARGAAVAVVTCGAEGSFVATKIESASTGVTPVDVVDTTGAGDSFIAGFLSVFIAGGALQQAIEGGRDHAALACAHIGGFPQEPMIF
jgi:fructoselysine 6-kinase